MTLSRKILQTLVGRHQTAQASAGLLVATATTASRQLWATSLQALSTQAQPEKEKQQSPGPEAGTTSQHAQSQHARQAAFSSSKPSHSAGPQEGQSSSSSAGSSSSSSSDSSSSQKGTASSSGTDPSVEDMTQRMFESFRTGYQNVRSRVESASKGSSEGGQDHRLLQEAAKEMQAVFRAGDHIRSATRMYTGPVAAAPGGEGWGPSELVLTKQRPTTWQKIHEKLGGLPFFSRLSGVKETSAYKKGREMYEDMREKYETTDHPAVHKIDDLKDRLVSGSEGSRAMREIRTRDPSFDMNNFVRSVKLDAPVVSKAFLNHDIATLKLHCGPELLERFSGIFKHFAEQGLFEDPTILFVGDVEVVEVKLLDDDPFVIVQFHCQQLKCTRDKFGNVIEGATDSIQRVYYFWGLQQEKQGVITAEGQVLPPRWVIRDMMWQSMLALV